MSEQIVKSYVRNKKKIEEPKKSNLPVLIMVSATVAVTSVVYPIVLTAVLTGIGGYFATKIRIPELPEAVEGEAKYLKWLRPMHNVTIL